MEALKQSILALSHDMQEIKSCLLSLSQKQAKELQNEWIDGQDVMLALKISPRTLQTMRDEGFLPYSQIRGKFYYKVSDLEKLFHKNYSLNLNKQRKHGTK